MSNGIKEGPTRAELTAAVVELRKVLVSVCQCLQELQAQINAIKGKLPKDETPPAEEPAKPLIVEG